ncbi:MAG: HipA domain-containing protein [Bacteroidales bacterium]|nr:HipA domain-containing protein [Bacteroidales bacterium]
MNICPITYQQSETKYSAKGLKKLSRRLVKLNDLHLTAEEQRREAAIRSSRMSIQGVQPKLSAILNVKNSTFEIVDINGKYILKPQHHIFAQVPENEDLTMKLAKIAGIEVPVHGLVFSKDGTLTYFIKRFDREGRNKKLPVEDFAQLAGLSRETKYNYTIEKIIYLVETYCTFPILEKAKLFKRILFNFFVGNEDMHLKNYSVIARNNQIELAPAYDFLNSTILLSGNTEETALKIKGKNKKLNDKILIDYLGKERMKLSEKTIENTISDFYNLKISFAKLINISFLNDNNKEMYLNLLNERMTRLGI